MPLEANHWPQDKKQFGAKVKATREHLKLTCKQLALQSRVSVQKLRHIERGG